MEANGNNKEQFGSLLSKLSLEFPRKKNILDKKWIGKLRKEFLVGIENLMNDDSTEGKELKEKLIDCICIQLGLYLKSLILKTEIKLDNMINISFLSLDKIQIQSLIEGMNFVINEQAEKLRATLQMKVEIIDTKMIEAICYKCNKGLSKCLKLRMKILHGKLVQYTLNFASKIKNLCINVILNLKENFSKTIQEKYYKYVKKISQIINTFDSLHLLTKFLKFNCLKKNLTIIFENAITNLFNSTESTLFFLKGKLGTIFKNFDRQTIYFSYENVYENLQNLNDIQFIVTNNINGIKGIEGKKSESPTSIDLILKKIQFFSPKELEEIKESIAECKSKYLVRRVSSIICTIENSLKAVNSSFNGKYNHNLKLE